STRPAARASRGPAAVQPGGDEPKMAEGGRKNHTSCTEEASSMFRPGDAWRWGCACSSACAWRWVDRPDPATAPNSSWPRSVRVEGPGSMCELVTAGIHLGRVCVLTLHVCYITLVVYVQR